MNPMPGVAPVEGLSGLANGIAGAGAPSMKSFQSMVEGYLGAANNLQVRADQAVQALAAGGNVDVHQVMISMEEAALAMQFTMAIRNRLVEAYQELSRMQV